MPTREDFPTKPVPTWEKVLGVAAAPFVPNLTQSIFQGPQRRAEAQYQGAAQDWKNEQENEVRQAQLRNINSEIEQRGKPKPATNAFEAWQQQNPNAPIGDWLKLEQGTKEEGKQPALDSATVSQINDMHAARYQVLNPGKPLPGSLTLRPGSTQADYDRIDKNLTSMESAQGTAAQRESTNVFRQDAAAQRAQDREDKREEKFGAPVYAYDPVKKQTVLTTQGAASKNNWQGIRKVSQPDIEKDTDKLRQIGDAQMNVSAYRASLTGMNALSGNDLARVGALIGDDKFKAHFFGLEIPVDWYNQLRDNQKFNALPEDAKDAVVGYIGARGSIIAYTKAISGTGRLTETQLATEMQNLPKPTDPPDVAERKFARFQRNIDQAASGLPKIPGIDTPAEIRAKTEIIRPVAQPPAQPKTAAPKGVRDKLVNFLNQKMGAQ